MNPLGMEFVNGNYHWLKNWFREARQFPNPHVPCNWEGAPAHNQMQIFKSSYLQLESGRDPFLAHAKVILQSAIYGVGMNGMVGDIPFRHMSGFFQLFGREPMESDHVGFYILIPERWFHVRRFDPFDVTKGYEIISECCVNPLPSVEVREDDQLLVHSISNIDNCPIVKKMMRPGLVISVNSALKRDNRDDIADGVTCPHCMGR
jgi:hypothetical protein